jgi:hypothetical protein
VCPVSKKADNFGWLDGMRGAAVWLAMAKAYFVKISFPNEVCLRRYAFPLCSISISFSPAKSCALGIFLLLGISGSIRSGAVVFVVLDLFMPQS